MNIPALAAATLAGALLLAPLQAQTPAPPSPVAAWSLDQAQGVSAPSVPAGRPAALLGGAAWGAGLETAHALALPGTAGSDAEVAGAPVVDTTRSYTVMACVRPEKLDGYQTFVAADGKGESAFFLQYREDTGSFAFVVPTARGDIGPIAGCDLDAQAGRWYHLAGVYDAAAHAASLYVDGVLQQTSRAPSAMPITGALTIGRGLYGGRPTDFVRGAIGDARVYQAALSGAAIRGVAEMDLPAADLAAAMNPPATPAALTVDFAAAPGPRVNPKFYGLMTEEINHSYDGGLYAELIQNRVLRDDAHAPAHWSLEAGAGASGALALDAAQPLSAALPVSLRLTVTAASASRPVGVANDGYWGVPIQPGQEYRASFYVRAAPGFAGPLTVSLRRGGVGGAPDGGTAASALVAGPVPTTGWRRCAATLRVPAGAREGLGRFVISVRHAGTLWLDLVSLFPPTYDNQPNGFRIDLMRRLASLSPQFLRLPGGNYLEGNTIAERFDWKRTLGPLIDRPGHQGPWGYRSSDGLGLLEYLTWCQDLHMEPLLAVYAGYSLGGEHVDAGPALAPYVESALQEIEYVAGDAKSSVWGRVRARDGHPAPFPLTYVEVGNEDFFDKSGSYEGRFAQFYDAIRAKYPRLKIISTTHVASRRPDLVDDHYYLSPRQMERTSNRYDGYDRSAPKVFVGEWASQEGTPTPDMNAALGDAAWLTGLERDADVVRLESYAPLLVNVSPDKGVAQWGTNLIGYDALASYVSPSYYVQAMFAAGTGRYVAKSTLTGGRDLYEDATRDPDTGALFIKLVNASPAAQAVPITLAGASKVAMVASLTVLRAARPTDTNTISAPARIAPRKRFLLVGNPSFQYTAPAYSVTVLRVVAR